jgi:Zn-dependent protease with chaperone function
MVGFYLLALGVAAGLVFVPYAMVATGIRLPVVAAKVVIFCLLGAAVILWAIVPRPDRFAAPGPALTPADQPRLWDTIRAVATATGQAPPAHIYLVLDPNAWVAHRGGVLGVGSRRVMGLGLPLLQVLTVHDFRAVLAHEFGHYRGGDTLLGPWVYKTSAAIERTIQGLAQHSSILHEPFLWYGRLFLRMTHAVSRRQELNADVLAARVVGARPLVEGLKKIQGVAPAFATYWTTEVVPVLEAGFRPPIAEGFRRFLAAGGIATQVAQILERALRDPVAADPSDTHPPLRERIRALEALPDGDPLGDDPMATTLLDDVPALERDLLARIVPDGRAATLTWVSWEDVARRVYVLRWRQLVRRHARHFQGPTFHMLPERATALVEALANTHEARWEDGGSAELRRRRGIEMLAVAMAEALTRAGWGVETQLGEPLILRRGSATFDPFAAVHDLTAGQIESSAWVRQCAERGIPDLPLVDPDIQVPGPLDRIAS